MPREVAETVLKVELCRVYPICEKFIAYMGEKKVGTLNMDQWDTMIDVFEILESHKVYDTQSSCIVTA